MSPLSPAGGARMAAMSRGPMRPARFRGLEDEEDFGGMDDIREIEKQINAMVLNPETSQSWRMRLAKLMQSRDAMLTRLAARTGTPLPMMPPLVSGAASYGGLEDEDIFGTLRMDAGEFGLSNDLLRDDLFSDFDQELEDVFGTLRMDADDFLVPGADVEAEISRSELFGGLSDDDPDLEDEDLEPLDEQAPRRAVVTGASSEAPHRGFFYKLFHRDISKRIARLQDKLKRQIETGRVEEAYATRGKIEEAMRTYKAMGQLASASEAEGVFEYRSPLYDS